MLLHKSLLLHMLAVTQFSAHAVNAALNPGPGRETRTERKMNLVGEAGEGHGVRFSDESTPTTILHYRPDTITLWGCGKGEHFSKYSLSYRNNISPADGKALVMHGSEKGSSSSQSLTLHDLEYVTSITVTTWKRPVYKHPFIATSRTRIGSISFQTNENRNVACGASDDGDQSYTFSKPEQAFLYFEGFSGDAIDKLEAWFIPVNDY